MEEFIHYAHLLLFPVLVYMWRVDRRVTRIEVTLLMHLKKTPNLDGGDE